MVTRSLFRYRISLICLCFGFLLPNASRSQRQSEAELFDLPLDTLYQLTYDVLATDSLQSRNIAEVYLRKCHIVKDTHELLFAYEANAWVWASHQTLSHRYADSMISLADQTANLEYQSKSRYLKGGLYYLSDEPGQALQHFITSYNFGVQGDLPKRMFDAIALIGSIKNQYGDKSNSILIQRRALDLLVQYKDRESFSDRSYLMAYDVLARSFTRMGLIDSARHYNNKAIALAVKSGVTDDYKDAIILDANINYYDNNLVKAKDTILKYLKSEPGFAEADNLYYLGMIEGKLGNERLKKQHFEQLDSIVTHIDFPLLDHIEEVYHYLLKDAINSNNKDLEKSYQHRLEFYDNRRRNTQEQVNTIAHRLFEVPFQENKDLKAAKELAIKRRSNTILLVIALLSVIGFISYLIRYQGLKRRFQRIMASRVNPIVEVPQIAAIKSTDIQIDDAIIQGVLSRLGKWEQRNGYLENEIDQNSLAKHLGTNSTYLSKIINTYKKQSFSNYLKDLRITYAINEIRENPRLIQTNSMIQLAEMFGFNSVSSFTRAFKSKAEISPSAFFRQLNKVNL